MSEELFKRQIPVYTRDGQDKLSQATILVIGSGGLGSTCATVLSRSGVGHLILVDDDVVSLSNIHRQFLYTHDNVGCNKVDAAVASPLLCMSKNTALCLHVDESSAVDLMEKYKPDVVMDCTDNFEVRFAVNKACVKYNVPMVFGAVTGNEGQISVVCHTKASPTCPCLSCIYPEGIPASDAPPVTPAICAIMGSMQAQQAISIITGVGKVLTGEFTTFNLNTYKMRTFKVRDRTSTCHVCGTETL